MDVRKLLYRDWFWAVLFLLPNLLGFLVFMLFPVLSSLLLSFVDWDLLTPLKWVGFGNYVNLAKDEVFSQVLLNTVVYSFGTVPLNIVIALFLAIALNQKLAWMRFYRAAYFIPVISSMVTVSIVWQWIYNPEFGLLNFLLSLIGIKGPAWLSSKAWAMPAIMITSIWKNVGFNMLLFLAGLQGISDSYYEAVDIDGGNSFVKFRFITVPLLSPTTFFIVVIAIINSFQVFDQVLLMTNGGPGRATSVIVHYLYQNAFQYFQMGYASAIAYVLFVMIFFVTCIQLARSKKWVLY